MRIVETSDVNEIESLTRVWVGMTNGEQFGIEVDVEVALDRLDVLMANGGSMLVAYEGDDPVGFFSLSAVPSYTGNQMIAMETNWFALPNVKTAGPKLLKAARQWAAEHECVRLMVSGSKLASELHDDVCRFCERVGGKHFETVYLMECV